MKKIFKSLFMLLVLGGLVFGASRAFFSDTETSTGNVFEAGAIDLKVSDTCHYYQNGEDVGCLDEPNATEAPFVTTWEVTDLEEGYHKFFYFNDLKPGDYGENTVDFVIESNPAWMCASFDAENYENTLVDPEKEAGDDDSDEVGELGNYLNIMWWIDDGNNVLEDGEKILYDGPMTLNEWLGIAKPLPLTFADSTHNWMGEEFQGDPMPASTPFYLGIGWCFGEMAPDYGSTTGFSCDGSGDQNDAQTDSIVGDVMFSVVQYRNNPDFVCLEHLLD